MSVPVLLSPAPGFCIKSSVLQPTVISIKNEQFQVSKGLKVFINIAWDKNVPPPPESSEEAIQRAMQGEDADKRSTDGWFVPVVVSEGRQDTDKAGKLAIIFDCVFNSSIKTRSLADPNFKIFLIELALQRIEAQALLLLSRKIGTPNISSKGKLTPRTVHVPSELFERLGKKGQFPPSQVPSTSASITSQGPKKPIIEEIASEEKPSSFDGRLKGILKSGSSASISVQNPKLLHTSPSNFPPIWRWSKEDDRLHITIIVPNLTHDLIKSTALDIEVRRMIINIPGYPTLDINLNLSDAEIVAMASTRRARAGTSGGASVFVTDIRGSSSSVGGDQAQTQDGGLEPSNTLMLKRQREFDVDAARAEWRVADGVLIIFA
ncbi:hypothetical protein AX15_007764 [Amanita polypyramis BW_CC]|nr:hypothetical protein AX15_007764 [Amanita polypyramis BW_CC]